MLLLGFLSVLLLFSQQIHADDKIENLHILWSQKSYEELVEQVEQLHFSGQFIEAQTLLNYLLENQFTVDVYFLWGQNLEYRGDFAFAIDIYTEILEDDIDPLFALDVRYRLGIAYDDAGLPKKAIQAWKKLLASSDFPQEHRAAVELLLGAAYIHNEDYKKGVFYITNGLKTATRDQDWMKARARNALAMVRIAQADEISLCGVDAQVSFDKRAQLLKDAEEQVIATVHLNKTSSILQGIIQMVDAYLRLYDDARTIAPPYEISYHKETIYFQTLREKSKTLLLRAENYLEKGLTIAKRQNWKGPETIEIEERLKAVRMEKKH